MTNKRVAIQIMENVGGQENVSITTHCATRLRLNLHDDSKASLSKLSEGIKGSDE